MKITVVCHYCKKSFFRSRNRATEAIRQGWNQYCSQACLTSSRITRDSYACANPKCNQIVLRTQGKIPKSNKVYCSQSCAATVNNAVFKKRLAKISYCQACNNPIKGGNKYCSNACIPRKKEISKEQIIELIQTFVLDHGRIPLREEFSNPKAARLRFGSWNKAVAASGFKPNPLKFSNKFIALDGHKCDSLAEKIIDDLLSSKQIGHERNKPYPNSRMTADFVIGNTYVEFFGLSGQLHKYDQSMKRKLAMVDQNGIKLIQIFPKDLHLKKNLEAKLQNF